jgi:DNA invertase Pin-like site-specific DNA recombinase
LTREGLNLLCDWCDRGIRFVSVTQQVDVSGSMGRIVAALMLGLAEIEGEYRRERQAAGIAVARRNGVYSKSGKQCYTIPGIFGFGPTSPRALLS